MGVGDVLSYELPSQCDVAIIGAGPIGLMLANLLGSAGVDVIVIERNNDLVGLPRAIAYDPETLRLFAQVGLFDAIASGLIQEPEVVYFNARGRRLMDMNPPKSPFGHSQIGTFYQPHFERVLLGGLERFASARALFGHTVTALAQDRDGVDVRIETQRGQRKLRAKFVVGCDGGASMTRDAIGAQLVGATYAERWLVIDALIENHDVDKITFFCDPRRPSVRLPAVGSRVRFEFMQLPGENPDELASDARTKEFLAGFVLGDGQSAVIADVNEDFTAPIDDRMRSLGGTVYRRAKRAVEDDVWFDDGYYPYDYYLYPYEYIPSRYPVW